MKRLLIILFVLTTFGFVSCRDDDDSNNTNNVNNTNNTNNVNNQDGHTISQVQDPSDPNFLSDGDTVNLKSVVVTAIDRYGDYTGSFWVSEDAAAPYQGVGVYNFDTSAQWWTDLQLGDLVNVSGIKTEYNYNDEFDDPVTQITEPVVQRLGTGNPIEPVTVQASDLLTVEDGEKWEGVLVTLANVRVGDVGERDGRYEVSLYQSTKAQDDMADLSSINQGECLSKLTGIVTYFFGYYLMPRSAADIEVAADDSACPTVANEICDNDTDDDGNGFTDCDDFACIGDPACPAKVENSDELCADGNDNDEDSLTDCDDPSCYGHPDVTICVEEDCTDTADNDGDGYTDCEDFDCALDVACEGDFETNCTDGNDDDGDSYVDCDDMDCNDDSACIESICDDEVDNDDDGHTDCEDFDCLYSDATCQVDHEVTDEQCSDGTDNDGNGFTDCDDFSCQRSPLTTVCEGNAITCADGIDNNGNGFVDCGDFACRYCDTDNPDNNRVVSTCPPCSSN